VPTWQMISRQPDELREVATRWADELVSRGASATVMPGKSTVGGGSLPGASLPTWCVALDVSSPDEMALALRAHRPAVVAIIKDGRLLVDPRTVQAGEESILLDALCETNGALS
jgi:L-seryl-tRNA(Ser) seleniumtransferase